MKLKAKHRKIITCGVLLLNRHRATIRNDIHGLNSSQVWQFMSQAAFHPLRVACLALWLSIWTSLGSIPSSRFFLPFHAQHSDGTSE